MSPEQFDAFGEARALAAVQPLLKYARFEVSTVTGANEYFSVNQETIAEWSLEPWAIPLLPRIRHAKGLVYDADDHEATVRSGAPAYLLDFNRDSADPEDATFPSSYLEVGEELELHQRYKCRIRTPWYRVPVVPAGELLLSKRSHRFPRAVVNQAGVVTTDTIYRGRMATDKISAADFVAAFHNSLTLLSAELEGRSFGGGVLELVPSEVGRVLTPILPGFGVELERLDPIVREHGTDSDDLVDETDRLLVKADLGLTTDLLARLREGRELLLQRRLARNAG